MFSPRCPYATDKCRAERPQRFETGTGHYAACHYAGDADFIKKNAPDTSRSRKVSVAMLDQEETKGGEA